ncbi:glutaredoxin family protein [Bacillus sp. FJAT-47783]|uniref:glutaredoxin family protein n=1 Tax=Bacillus sp. FJAT-47783 TaxID=2922712 RepID=UPI001FAE70DC|nr:glutaredoxin family protein [Bacillus sp. FJAT-47783]
MVNLLYTIDGCHICAKVKGHLREKNVSFKEVNVLEDRKGAQQLKELIGEVYTPVFVSEDKVMKGLGILMFEA